MHLTPEAKTQLSNTIRTLRERLLTDLHNAVDSAYRLSISATQAGLPEEEHQKRKRLEEWLKEQARSEAKGNKETEKQRQERYLHTAVKLAAATLLNRLIVIKQMEAQGLIKPAVVTGGWQSPAYREFRDFAPELLKDETEGYGTLLKLLFDELAQDLPGLFGNVGVTALFPIPASTLRAIIEALDNPGLKDAWLDDTTLGWVYQYWNDPEREALDAKLNGGGKVEPHEIASKTQMFTERYMVEWLLHNSLGQIWLAICQHQGWTPAVEADGTLQRLEARREEWREKRERGEVALDALMTIETPAEERWKYWVSQPLTDAAVTHAANSIREVRILDPACGSGHFLVIAFGLLFALYQEEAQHRGESWSDREIVESILENNLYGIDIDARAVQIAAAALVLKARLLSKQVEVKRLNLVASNLQLSALAEDDPARVELREEVKLATGIPEQLTDKIVEALKGADYLGSLLKVDAEVDQAINQYEQEISIPLQLDIFQSGVAEKPAFDSVEAKKSLLEKLESFLNRCTSGDDLGLRLRGEQLAAGVRFIRIVQENFYHLVIGNPPYQGTSKMVDAKYVAKEYSKGKENLYAAFLERSLQLANNGGFSALVVMRNWMFIQQFSKLREWLLDNYDLRMIGDLNTAAFEDVQNSEVLAVMMSIFIKSSPSGETSIAMQSTPLDENVYDRKRTKRKQAALLSQVWRYEFWSDRFNLIKEKPLIYWWDDDFLRHYAETPKLGDETDVRVGLQTANNTRFLRQHWEINIDELFIIPVHEPLFVLPINKWVPYIKGAEGKAWFEPLTDILLGKINALEVKLFERDGKQASRPQNENFYFCHGIAFPSIGSKFTARSYRFRSVFGNAGLSVFPKNIANAACLMNSRIAQEIIASLNPTVNFLVGDVKRLPLFPIESADEIFTKLEEAFTEHEAARETSVEFRQPAPSAWNYTQTWAQTAVDREPGTPLPPYQPTYEQPPATNYISYALGIALGRFHKNGAGIITGDKGDEGVLPHGILYLSAYDDNDSLQHPACEILQQTWKDYSTAVAKGKTLREWLRQSFFKDIHLGMYENRPIYFPLSSAKKNFVAYISIHRWTENTLQTLLADYLIPELSQIEGELNDLIESRNQGDKKTQAKAEERYNKLQQQQTELKTFIDNVRQCAEQGPPPANAKDTPRQANARFHLDLDDGVMINIAALWPLLEPQWTQPKKWWSELSNAQGKKDYDWSHLAARYFPQRVDEKCQQDPSLAVAHGCFWKYHPAKAYEWELRLQDEIAPDFTIDEIDSDPLRQEFIDNNPELVAELTEKEEKRRDRKRKKQDPEEDWTIPPAPDYEED
ncbi:BREX-6 system adenine-specific DNA-methyltransferase PglX [Nostoc sp. NMS4]|uniref:BREX-6 system adenine-specific DNA-methyltransferase PglX n=1 Tax=Nostoc sp. NMS4 TaxID=2815390 RepID=UPI0025D624C5|nr:BREX-6 system adenine-specific DNA-methyltransferase PglX [Nostoc sp. NMS4]